jgi:hypothetical protein
MSVDLDTHYNSIGNLLEVGKLAFFLGAGANLCGRTRSESWRPGRELPDGGELAQYLAEKWRYQPRPLELGRVAQYIEHHIGDGPLNDQLHELFDADYPYTQLHDFLAGLPKQLVEKGYPTDLIILSTNYDDVLERAFSLAGQPFDLLTYLNLDPNAQGIERGGRFLHTSHDGDGTLIEVPNEYLLETDDLGRLARPIIIKLHGAVDRIRREFDSFVISEDDYVDYLALTPEDEFLTAQIRGLLKNRHFLFMGYGLRDWNLRVILRRIWRDRTSKRHSFAVVLDADELEEQFWSDKDVEMLKIDLSDYVEGLKTHITALPAKEPL